MKKSITFYFILLFTVRLLAQVDIQTNGGQYYTSVLSNGPTAQKYDIVFIGDGFTAAQQATFNQKVNEAVDALRALVPYSETMCALNIWRVNVLSEESGCDHPKDGIFKNTELDCRYGNPAAGEAERCIRSDSPAKCFEAAAYAPASDATFVLVNDTQWGGCAGTLVFSSISSNFAQIITHELGHKIGFLADEYTCYVCDGSDDNVTWSGGEPDDANLTINTNRATTKWGDLINAATPIPTTSNTPPGVVGLWQGGGYAALGVYRPQSTCQMKSSSQPFCAVCGREMRALLEDHCTFCELNPGSFMCFRIPIEVAWWARLRLRWPIPPCLSCPPDDFLKKYEIIFEQVTFQGTEARVYDESGTVIVESAVRQNGEPLRISFEGNRFKKFEVEIITGEPVSKTFNATPKYVIK